MGQIVDYTTNENWMAVLFPFIIWLSYKDWELPNSRIWLAEISIESGLGFPI